MKLLFMVPILALIGCTAGSLSQHSATASRNLTVQEVRALPAGISLNDLDHRLRYFTRAAIDLPLISFLVEGDPDTKCVVSFDSESGRLRYAWIVPKGKDIEVVWPRAAAGKKLDDIEDLFVDKKEANQPPQPTPSGRG